MKILRKKIDNHTGGGSVEVEPESVEDMWQLYNLIQCGDKVRAVTWRKVMHESTAGKASTAERVKIKLTVDVTSTNFDSTTGEIRCSGRNAEQHEHVKLGAYQTLDLELHRPIDITKRVWDSRSMEVLRELSAPAVSADLAVVLMDGNGKGEVLAITPSLTLPRATVEVSVPKKRAGTDKHGSSLAKFFDALTASIARTVDFSKVKVCVLASPGFVKDELWAHMKAVVPGKAAGGGSDAAGYKGVQDNWGRFVLAHAPSGHRRDLVTVLYDPALQQRLSDTKVAGEVKVLGAFFDTLVTCAERAHYGYPHVRAATDRGAVDKLLLTDGLFRSFQPGVRELYSQLCADVRAAGGSVHVLSSAHAVGDQLGAMGGVAALLRYPVTEEEVEEQVAAIRKAGVPGMASAGAGTGRGGGQATAAGDGQHDSGHSHGHGHGQGGPGAGGDTGYDSDGSSDSDASYKKR